MGSICRVIAENGWIVVVSINSKPNCYWNALAPLYAVHSRALLLQREVHYGVFVVKGQGSILRAFIDINYPVPLPPTRGIENIDFLLCTPLPVLPIHICKCTHIGQSPEAPGQVTKWKSIPYLTNYTNGFSGALGILELHCWRCLDCFVVVCITNADISNPPCKHWTSPKHYPLAIARDIDPFTKYLDFFFRFIFWFSLFYSISIQFLTGVEVVFWQRLVIYECSIWRHNKVYVTAPDCNYYRSNEWVMHTHISSRGPCTRKIVRPFAII